MHENLDGIAICPLPKAPKQALPFYLRSLMDYSLTRRGLSWATWLFSSPSFYTDICNQETEVFIEQMWTIYHDHTKALEERALLLKALAAYGLASRPAEPYAAQDNLVAKPIPLPIYREGVLSIEACVLIKDFCLHTVPVRVFAPVNGLGSPIYLFTPTGAWPKAAGMTEQILDDLNPLGPGTFLQNLAKETFPPVLHTLIETYQERVCFIGHSLGGILATSIALEMPELVQHVCAFSPSRPFPALIKKWDILLASLPAHKLPMIHTYIPEWSNGQDPITWLGGDWIGTVHRIRHHASSNPLDRHASFVIPQTAPLQAEPYTRSSRSAMHVGLSVAIHRVVVTCLLAISLFCIGLKRLLIGWKQGKVLRFGVLGLPFTLYSLWKTRIWSNHELDKRHETK